MTATTVNGRDQITAATVAGANTTNSYLGETQTNRLTANNGSATTTFQATMLGLISQTTSATGTSYARTPDGQPIATTSSGNSNYFLTDNLGSTVGLVSSTGSKTAAYAYDPYGRTRTATGTAAMANAIRYTGGPFDTTTGTTKLGARYYDPSAGRFSQPDPSGREQNAYAYAGENPIGHKDPSGLDWICDPFSGCWDDSADGDDSDLGSTSCEDSEGLAISSDFATLGAVVTAPFTFGGSLVILGALGASVFASSAAGNAC